MVDVQSPYAIHVPCFDRDPVIHMTGRLQIHNYQLFRRENQGICFWIHS